MEIATASSEYVAGGSPIELIEEFADNNGLTYQRDSVNEITVECAGHWCDYVTTWYWSEETKTLGIANFLNLRVPEERINKIYELLALVNEKLWVGHFELSSDSIPNYRHTLLLNGIEDECTQLIEETMSIALGESERFYPAFQFVIWGGKKPKEALDAAMIDAVGEA